MKIITLHKRINADELFNYLQQHINPLFKQQRQTDVSFKIEKNGDHIEIAQPELYPGDILFQIKTKGTDLHIIRSEHYVDDVNSLTLESILNDLFNDLSGRQGTDLVLEG